MEILTVSLFCIALILCVCFDISILIALSFGLLMFSLYAAYRRYSFSEIFKMILDGVKGARTILIVFAIIGALTALWRASGTIPAIISLAVDFIRPNTVILMTFLLCSLLSILTGTSFGTAATMGVICMTAASTMGVYAPYVGGAILAGSFFGDRCSPVSTSALLVSELTETDIFSNIKGMIRSAVVPFALSALGFYLLGLSGSISGELPDIGTVFESEFNLHPTVLIPALVIVVFSLFRVKVKLTMLASSLAAFIISIFVQGETVGDLLRIIVYGYAPSSEAISEMLSGGGILSMVRSIAIVCISSAYAGIFKKTGMLHAVKDKIYILGEKTTVYLATMITAALTGTVACNQTLAIMLTHQLCGDGLDKHSRAMNLEDTAVVIAPLIPWSIACAVPLTSSGAPTSSVFFAFFLYLLPLWRLTLSFVNKARKRRNQYENDGHNKKEA